MNRLRLLLLTLAVAALLVLGTAGAALAGIVATGPTEGLPSSAKPPRVLPSGGRRSGAASVGGSRRVRPWR
jgi:hypothetical protein